MPDRDLDFSSYPALYCCGADEIKNNSSLILAGKTPSKEDEVMVSDIFYNRHIMQTDSTVTDFELLQTSPTDPYKDFAPMEFEYVDMYADKFANYFSNSINMYDFIGKVK